MVACSECPAAATAAHVCPDGAVHQFCERHSRAFILEMVLRGYSSGSSKTRLVPRGNLSGVGRSFNLF